MSVRGEEQVEKKYDPLDTTLKFVNRRDDLDPVCKIHFLSHWACRQDSSCGFHFITDMHYYRWSNFIEVYFIVNQCYPKHSYSFSVSDNCINGNSPHTVANILIVVYLSLRWWRRLSQSRDVLQPRCHSWFSHAMVSQPAGWGVSCLENTISLYVNLYQSNLIKLGRRQWVYKDSWEHPACVTPDCVDNGGIKACLACFYYFTGMTQQNLALSTETPQILSSDYQLQPEFFNAYSATYWRVQDMYLWSKDQNI